MVVTENAAVMPEVLVDVRVSCISKGDLLFCEKGMVLISNPCRNTTCMISFPGMNNDRNGRRTFIYFPLAQPDSNPESI